eukprot:TRINITY_DN9625_c0_g1_i1.p1 TRINITY_DN9625_c0_g1~~TRINITY_DN9625_c0_g1_i1.p1  ORF type:complete len:393 (+),score=55.74 TRINITY_DN9625_c0_g1_i1:459-1637(+)
MREIRRKLHQHPEIMFELNQTNQIVQEYLQRLNIKYSSGFGGGSGIVGVVGQGKPVIALRSDMDALPILEPNGTVPFVSKNEGAMHACGHDVHMAMLLGAAAMLKRQENQLKGTVKLVFQPAEEGGAGAKVMVHEGVVDDVDMMFGLHVWPDYPIGTIATKAGTIMCAGISFQVTIHGKGGHGAMPHDTIDPIIATVNIINVLQSLVSRETSPLESVSLSITKLNAGYAYNVVPDNATFGGRLMSLKEDTSLKLQQRLDTMIKNIATSFGCEASIDWMQNSLPYYPPVINHPDAYSFAKQVSQRLMTKEFEEVRTDILPSMPGEDFAFFGQKVPSCFIFLGMRNKTAGSIYPLHNPNFMVDENVMVYGATLHASLALHYLANNTNNLQHTEL